MAARTPLTPLGISALALLSERPMHPYEMYQILMHRREDRVVKVRPGSLYHTVDRLEAHEMVVAVGTDREGNRPERTTYEITAAGRAALVDRITELLSTPVKEYPSFPLAISEAHELPRERVETLLTGRLAVMRDELATMESTRSIVLDKPVARRFWLDLDYIIAIRRAEIAWLDGVLNELSSGALPWSE